MKEIDEYHISALHYIAKKPDDAMMQLSKFIVYRWKDGDWIYGIKCICQNDGLIFIG